MAMPNSFQDDINYHKQSHSQFTFPTRPSRVRAVPDSSNLLLSPGIRRVESSPPVVMGTPSPPLLPTNATLRVRKRRIERSLTAYDAAQSDDSRYTFPPAHQDDQRLNQYDETSMGPSNDLPAHQADHRGNVTRSDAAVISDKENIPVYFRELNNEDFPVSLQRRESGKRKAFVKMLDGAKSKYPRLSQRSFTTTGLIRRSSTKTATDPALKPGNLSLKHSSLGVDSQTKSIFEPSMSSDRIRRDGTKSTDLRLMNMGACTMETSQVDDHCEAPLEHCPADIPQHSQALLSMQLHILSEISVLNADDDESFWIAIEAEAVLHNSAHAQHHTMLNDPVVFGELCDVVVTIEACQGCTIRTVIGSKNEAVLRAHQTMLIMVRVEVGRRQPAVHDQNSFSLEDKLSELDIAFHELETLLGESLNPMLFIQCRYRHTLLPDHSEVSTQEACFLRRTSCGSLWAVPSEDDGGKSRLHAKVLHEKLIFALATELLAVQALSELDQSFTASRPCACPDYLEMARRSLQVHLATHGDECVTDKEDVLARLSPPQPRLPRFSHETYDKPFRGLAGVFQRPPTHVILPLGGLKSTESAARHSADDDVDHAQEIWRHMRNRSKGDETPLRPRKEALRELQNLDKPLWEIRKLALQNKRSVGADTLRSLAASTRGFGDGTHGPWL
ncbi:hypothetical protein EJ05DRAFT_486805 [Pseudovirgaria hyperparasitica]|uniref:Uncharacterized protein n=1 Tax=Pseudovirgaria hyperparasitica TaxID=470096 RepID=A0A6A6W890_9PEZI|nr:uncharacterized protein EJ05DRAFT_486805 [Pseudovirgaria hyperparasitica]KAF2757797.1 hypothetical protein EJ05DRAFT_486805 [Pseudovirgaria hyperparasitica]